MSTAFKYIFLFAPVILLSWVAKMYHDLEAIKGIDPATLEMWAQLYKVWIFLSFTCLYLLLSCTRRCDKVFNTWAALLGAYVFIFSVLPEIAILFHLKQTFGIIPEPDKSSWFRRIAFVLLLIIGIYRTVTLKRQIRE